MSYDEERARLTICVSGSLDTTISMLKLVNKLVEPEGKIAKHFRHRRGRLLRSAMTI